MKWADFQVSERLSNFSSISWWEQLTSQWDDDDDDDDICFVQDQYTQLDFYSTSSLKQRSACRHDDPLGCMIRILSQPVCSYCMLSGEAANKNFIVFGLTWPVNPQSTTSPLLSNRFQYYMYLKISYSTIGRFVCKIGKCVWWIVWFMEFFFAKLCNLWVRLCI